MSSDFESEVAAALHRLGDAPTLAQPAVDELLDRAASSTSPNGRNRRRSVGVAAAGVAVVGLLGTTIAVLSRGDADTRSPGSPPTVAASPVTATPTTRPASTPTSAPTTVPGGAQPRVVAEIPASPQRGRLAFDGQHVWQAGTWDNTLLGIDPATRHVVATLEGMPGPYLTTGDGAVFVCGSGGTVRVDAGSGQMTASSPQGCYVSIAYGDGSVWVAGRGGVVRLDATTLEEQAVIPDVVAQWGISFAFGSVWVADGRGNDEGQRGHVTRIDPGNNTVSAVISTPGMARLFAAGDDELWLTLWGKTAERLMLVRIDPATNTITGSVPGGEATEVVVAGDLLVLSGYNGAITVVDPDTMQAVSRFEAHPAGARSDATAIAWDGQVLWQRLTNAAGQPDTVIIAIDLGRYGPP